MALGGVSVDIVDILDVIMALRTPIKDRHVTFHSHIFQFKHQIYVHIQFSQKSPLLKFRSPDICFALKNDITTHNTRNKQEPQSITDRAATHPPGPDCFAEAEKSTASLSKCPGDGCEAYSSTRDLTCSRNTTWRERGLLYPGHVDMFFAPSRPCQRRPITKWGA